MCKSWNCLFWVRPRNPYVCTIYILEYLLWKSFRLSRNNIWCHPSATFGNHRSPFSPFLTFPWSVYDLPWPYTPAIVKDDLIIAYFRFQVRRSLSLGWRRDSKQQKHQIEQQNNNNIINKNNNELKKNNTNNKQEANGGIHEFVDSWFGLICKETRLWELKIIRDLSKRNEAVHQRYILPIELKMNEEKVLATAAKKVEC